MGHAVNFIAGLGEASLSQGSREDLKRPNFYSDEAERGFQEMVSNMLSLVAELPLAEVAKPKKLILSWQGDWRLRSDFGYLDEILDSALASSQMLAFERPRYQANKENYYRLRQSRKEHDQRTFVEFSPSPNLTPEARQRGYFGNSCIFFYEFDPEKQTETIYQRWLKASWSDFYDLLGLVTEHTYSDAQIMRASNFFEPEDIQMIEAFIDNHHGRIGEKVDEIYHYVDTSLRAFLIEQLTETLQRGVIKLIEGQEIAEECEEIKATLAYAQLKLKNKIAKMTNLETSGPYLTDEEERLYDQNMDDRIKFVEKEHIPLYGCGINTETSSRSGSSSDVYGRADSFSAVEDQYGSLWFECPHCQQMVPRPLWQLVTICLGCFKTIPACEKEKKLEEDEMG